MQNIVFDTFFEDYDSWYTTQMGAFVDELETETAFSLLQPKAGMRILDVGCGTGNFSLKLAQLGARVTGIDIAENMLNQATAKTANTHLPIQFLKGNAAHMPFQSNSFDAVLSMTAFEFIPNPYEVYLEMKRILKPGGIIVIGTIQKGGDWANLYSSDVCKGTAYEYANFLSKADLTALDPACVEATKETLYTPPTLPEHAYTMETENKYQTETQTGGFVCVKFKKESL